MESHTASNAFPGQPGDRVYYFAFVSIVMAGLFLRLHQLGADSLWIDEAFTGFLALTAEWSAYLRGDNTPPLYYLAQRAWCGVVACDESGVRMSSVVAGTLFIALAGRFSERLCGRGIALLVLIIVAVAPLHFYYSQEARVYSVLMMALLGFLYLQWQVIEQGETPGRMAGLFIASTASLYLHYFAILPIGTCVLVYLIRHRLGQRRVPFSYFIAVGGSFLALVPWLYLGLFSEQATRSEIGWIEGYLADKPLWQMPWRTLMAFLNGPLLYVNEMNLFVKRYTFADISTAWYGVYYLFTALAAGAGLFLLFRPGYLPSGSRRFFVEISLFMVIPLLALLGISLLLRPVYVVGRYDLIAYPAFIMWLAILLHAAAHGGAPLRTRLSGLVIAGSLLFSALMFSRIFLYKQTMPYDGIRSDVPAVVDRLADGDGLLIANPEAVLYWYYLHADGYDRHSVQCAGPDKQFTCRLFPQNLEQAPALQQRYYALSRAPGDSSPDISYFLDDLSPDSGIVLIVEQLALEQGNLQLDPIGFQILARLSDAGYRVEEVVTGARLLRLGRINRTSG